MSSADTVLAGSVLSLISGLTVAPSYFAFFPQALDQANLNSEGLALSIEEQLGALTLSELQTPDSKSTVYLNGTAFQTDIFDINRESTKVFCLCHSYLLSEVCISALCLLNDSRIVTPW